MPSLNVNGCPINYIVEGTGKPVMLIHGFASSLQGNWRAPGIVDAIVRSGRQVIAIDCRGHGRSGKPHDPAAYEGVYEGPTLGTLTIARKDGGLQATIGPLKAP